MILHRHCITRPVAMQSALTQVSNPFSIITELDSTSPVAVQTPVTLTDGGLGLIARLEATGLINLLALFAGVLSTTPSQ